MSKEPRKSMEALTHTRQIARIRELCAELEAALKTPQKQRDRIARIRKEADELCRAVSNPTRKGTPTAMKKR